MRSPPANPSASTFISSPSMRGERPITATTRSASLAAAHRILIVLFRQAPDQARLGAANGFEIFNLHRIGVILFQMVRFGLGGRRMVDVPVFGDQLAVEPHAVAILSGEADQIVASLRRNDDAGPADGIFLQSCGEAPVSPQAKSTDSSVREISGAPSSFMLEKYSAFRPCSSWRSSV